MATDNDATWGRRLVGKGPVPYKPWLASATVLLKTLTASTPEEQDRLAVELGFNKAFREFKRYLVTLRQNPAEHDGQRFQDSDLEKVLLTLNGAALGSTSNRGNPISDLDGFRRRGAMGAKVHDLMNKLAWTPK